MEIIEVIPENNKDALELIKELDAELCDRYPASSVHTLDLSKIDNKSGKFILLLLGGIPVGCGSVVKLEDSVGEIKRVFVKKACRGNGYARIIMKYLESVSLELGFRKLRLETGIKQPEALKLYNSLGFYQIEKYGEYSDDPNSICMEKIL
jgi:GNAT superfamily N-acetyltransferase